MIESDQQPTIVALIPARSGSKRLRGKNVRPLAGHPLIAYTITAAIESGIFDAVFVSTDSKRYAEVARYYGAEVPFLRPPEFSHERSPDIEFVAHALRQLELADRRFDCFSILRPTSPFRQADTIRRAWKEFLAEDGVDSLRAVERCKQHPGKMWVVRGNRMLPLLPLSPSNQPWHSSQYQTLPEVYVQNASLEIAWSRVVHQTRTIAGTTLVPFLTQDCEGLDINDERDWLYAEHLIQQGEARLPSIEIRPFLPEGVGF
jgi:N-acylneuraminate cytidylyltransferase